MSPTRFAEQLSDAASQCLPILFDAALKGLVILTLCAAVSLLLRRASAAARHFVWFLGIASLALLPALALMLPSWRILPADAMPERVIPLVTTAVPAEVARSTESQSLPLHELHIVPSRVTEVSEPRVPAAASSPPVTPAPAIPATLTPGAWILVVWVAGILLCLLPIAAAFLSLSRLERAATRVAGEPFDNLLHQLSRQTGLSRRVVLLQSDDRSMPMTWGVFRTFVLLPREASDWGQEKLRAVLLHELAHVRRRDCLTQLITRVIAACYWFNPLTWLAWHRMQSEQEQACDDLVLVAGTKASSYAEDLLRIASIYPAHRLNAAAIAMARPSKLETRLRAILDLSRTRRTLTRLGIVAAIALAAVIVVPLSIIRAAPKDQAHAAEVSEADRAHGALAEAAVANAAKATLKSGATVEILGISEHASAKRSWWRPDGSPLAEAPYDSLGVQVLPKAGTVTREFACRIGGVKGDAIDLEWLLVPAGTGRGGSGVAPKNGVIIENTIGIIAQVSDHQRDLTMRVGVASGPWKSIARCSSKGVSSNLDDHGVLFNPSHEEDGKTVLTVSHDVTGHSVRLVAVSEDGRIHTPGLHQSEGAGKLNQLTDTFTLPIKSIREFQLQVRPYEWAEFKDLPLGPRAKIDPQSAIPKKMMEEGLFTGTVRIHPDREVFVVGQDGGGYPEKKALSDSGHAAEFRTVEGHGWQVTAVNVYTSRYGEEHPERDVRVSVCDPKGNAVKEFTFPYATFHMGEPEWTYLALPEPVDVGDRFIICVATNSSKSAGIYLHHDGAKADGTEAQYIGLPGKLKPFSDGNWKIRARIERQKKNSPATTKVSMPRDGQPGLEAIMPTQKPWHPSPPAPVSGASAITVIPSPYAARGGEPIVPWDLVKDVKVGQTKEDVIKRFRDRGHSGPADEDAEGRYLLFATSNDQGEWEVALRMDSKGRVAEISYKKIPEMSGLQYVTPPSAEGAAPDLAKTEEPNRKERATTQKGRTPTTVPATAPAITISFTTDSVWTSKGHGGVILTGTLADGAVRVRQWVTVHTSGGPIEAKIERIESTDGQHADLPQASKGQKVRLFFPRVTEDQVSEGTRVTSDGVFFWPHARPTTVPQSGL